jgi:Fe-S-cluster containining protein
MSKKLPCRECGGRCCTHAPFHMREWLKIKERFPVGEDAIVEEVFPNTAAHGVIVWREGTNKQCYFLENGRCAIYNYRPRTCRKTAEDGVCAYTNPDEIIRRVAAMKANGHTFLSERD